MFNYIISGLYKEYDGAWSRLISRPIRDRKPKFNYNFLLLLVIYLIILFRIYLLRFL